MRENLEDFEGFRFSGLKFDDNFFPLLIEDKNGFPIDYLSTALLVLYD